MIDAAAGLLLVEGFLQAAHNLGSCYQANSGWNIWLFQGFLIDCIALSGSILDFLYLNMTDFDHFPTILQYVHTWVGVNII